MLKTFVLIVTMWNPTANTAGAYALDTGMSGEDCIALLLDVSEAESIELEPGYLVRPADVNLSCEIDDAA